ncbi:acyl-CoA dehydrogenase family protein [Actinoallomurus bryophytorum]|uniref:Alkylation response protein AidB-like acyl-CoA dehydrogenase n=1 Tax=Actinoallomurus bryophytorum TaxID=1490222 RepID=A0A543C0N8_9ACTN|nr:acyl-CoA dehydrogenase family protein [Actinoallomurus bryophytorum]TQL90647.1 alkylation response protein AidB-like acyl-CoA dehydrogenase [Actinoallomurus bryophytorum]
MTFSVPSHVRPVRDAVHAFMTSRVEPAEPLLVSGDSQALRALQQEAKDAGLWALGHPKELGGGGMPFLDYVYVNEVQGRSEWGQLALGTFTLQDSLMLNEYAEPEWRERYLAPMVAGEISPSFAMTEPEATGSDPTGIRTTGTLEGDEWVIRGHKWFTTGAAAAAYTTVMCRTEPEDTPPHRAFSMIIVPTSTPGYRIVRETPVLGLNGGHFEVLYDDVRVPAGNLLGPRGQGFRIAQQRLGPGRIFHCMRWLGQAQRAFDLLCGRLNSRSAFGGPLADKQLMQQHVFDSYAEIQAARLLTLQAAEQIDAGDEARVEIGVIKVVGARMLHNVVDRAIQAYGAAGLTDDTPLSRMYRHAREARLYDGPDEVHIQSTSRRILREYRNGGNWEFGLR